MDIRPLRWPLLKGLGEAAAIIGVSFLTVSLYSRVPFTMDSYIFYSNLASWWYPMNALDPFTRMFDLVLFPHSTYLVPDSAPLLLIRLWDSIPFKDSYLPLRAYTYIGSLPSLVYFPLFLAWPSPDSARFLGLLILAAEAVLICRMVRYDVLGCFLILCAFMPYAFQHVVDYGPVALQLVIVYCIACLIGDWMRGLQHPRALDFLYPVAIGLLIFAGIWCKLSFIFCLPALALIVLHHAVEQRTQLAVGAVKRRFFLHCLILCAIAGVLTDTLLNATTRPPSERRYYQCSSTVMQAGFEESGYAYSPARQGGRVAMFFCNPLLSAYRIQAVDHTATPSGVMLCVSIVAMLVYGTVRLRQLKRGIRAILLNLAACGMVLVAVISFPPAGSIHHVMLAYPFLLLAIFSILSELRGDRIVAALLTLFIALNLWQYCRLAEIGSKGWEYSQGTGIALVPHPRCLIEEMDRHSDRYVFVHVDWGSYYIKALYGKRNQCNVAEWPLNTIAGVRKVRDICAQTGRKPMFVRMKENSGTDLAFLNHWFPGLIPLKAECDAGPWEIWYQPWARSRRYLHRR